MRQKIPCRPSVHRHGILACGAPAGEGRRAFPAGFKVSGYRSAPILCSVFLLISFTPRPHGVQDGFEAFAELGQRILHSRRHLGIDLAVDESALLHGTQQRLGYSRAELDEFCRQVRTHITPLYLRLQEEQHLRLGVDVLMPYDRSLVFLRATPSR